MPTFLSSLSTDSQSSPLVRSGLLGSARVPQGSATCMSWGGAHYRTFDRKHFHFQGSCTYMLASSSDGTWAVYISTVCDGTGACSKVQKIPPLMLKYVFCWQIMVQGKCLVFYVLLFF